MFHSCGSGKVECWCVSGETVSVYVYRMGKKRVDGKRKAKNPLRRL